MNLTLFFMMGLGLGVTHAFDPDHLAAVGAVGAGDGNQHSSYADYAIRWSLGHGSALGLMAIMVFSFGAAIPEDISDIAERSVAFLLVALGAAALWRNFSHKYTLKNYAKKSAGIVGLIHGTAGSAPLLVLIPLGMAQSPFVGLLYVAFFSAGVGLAMVALGKGLTTILHFCGDYQAISQRVASISFATFSIVFGFYLLCF